MIFLGVLIGILIAIVIDFILQTTILNSISEIVISLCYIIWDFLCSITSPIRHPKAFIWLLKHKYNPFHLSVSELCKTSDEEFDEWLQFVSKEDVDKWERHRKDFEIK